MTASRPPRARASHRTPPLTDKACIKAWEAELTADYVSLETLTQRFRAAQKQRPRLFADLPEEYLGGAFFLHQQLEAVESRLGRPFNRDEASRIDATLADFLACAVAQPQHPALATFLIETDRSECEHLPCFPPPQPVISGLTWHLLCLLGRAEGPFLMPSSPSPEAFLHPTDAACLEEPFTWPLTLGGAFRTPELEHDAQAPLFSHAWDRLRPSLHHAFAQASIRRLALLELHAPSLAAVPAPVRDLAETLLLFEDQQRQRIAQRPSAPRRRLSPLMRRIFARLNALAKEAPSTVAQWRITFHAYHPCTTALRDYGRAALLMCRIEHTRLAMKGSAPEPLLWHGHPTLGPEWQETLAAVTAQEAWIPRWPQVFGHFSAAGPRVETLNVKDDA